MPRGGRQAGKRASERRRRASRLAPERRRAQLLECALEVFAQRGIGEARHAEIARRAGVSLATTFVYFPSRRSLVEAVLREVSRFYRDQAAQVHERVQEPADAVLLAHARAFADSVRTHPAYARVWLHWSTSIRDREWPLYLAFQDQVEAIIAGTIARGQREGTLNRGLDPVLGARLMISGAHMVVQMQLSGRQEAEIRGFVDTVVRALGAVMAPE